MAGWCWDEGRIAKKLGNAGGVKALTAVDRGWRNICHIQRWRTDGKRPNANREQGPPRGQDTVHVDLSLRDGLGASWDLLQTAGEGKSPPGSMA